MQFVQGIIIPTLFLDWPPVEDISFLRKDGRPWLITIMHEKEAYFMLDPDEVPLVMGQLPPHSLIAEGDAESPDERY